VASTIVGAGSSQAPKSVEVVEASRNPVAAMKARELETRKAAIGDMKPSARRLPQV
jgi:hypothetical protein